MARKYVYDRYDIELPGDLFATLGWHENMRQFAIDEARERARLYVVPCEWTAKSINGEPGDFTVTVRVVRKRLKK